MKTYTNIFGTKISHKPFYQTSLNTWRIARYENDKLDNCEFVDIIGDTKSNTIKLIRENKQYVYRGKYHIDN